MKDREERERKKKERKRGYIWNIWKEMLNWPTAPAELVQLIAYD